MNVKDEGAEGRVRQSRRAEQSEATRGDLVRVARRLFAERGFAGVAAEEIVQEAGKRGVFIPTLAPFYLGVPNRNGLLLGYGGLTLNEISQGATILAEVIASVASKMR